MIRSSVCEGIPDYFTVLLSGKPPFVVKYKKKLAKHSWRNSEKAMETVADFENQVGQLFARIPLSTDQPGRYTYELGPLADDNYKTATDVAIHDGTKAYRPILEQIVFPKPKASFLNPIVYQCLQDEFEDKDSNKDDIIIQLDGQPPFELTMGFKHENHPKEIITVSNITSSKYIFRPPQLNLLGKYTLQINRIKDGNQCDQSLDSDSSDVRTTIHISDVARITSLHSKSICVGDILSYSVQGTPPFTIDYTLDNIMQEQVKVQGPAFSIAAAVPGIVQIQRICNSVGCCTHPQDLITTIHDLPTAIVSGGMDVVEDIREGDETSIKISFSGEPPFTFTWKRSALYYQGSDLKGNNKKSDMLSEEESYTVTDIQTNE